MLTRYLQPGTFARMLTLAVLLNFVAYASPQETAPSPNNNDPPVADSTSSQVPDQAAPASSGASSPEPAASKDQLPDSPGASQPGASQSPSGPTTPAQEPQIQQPQQSQNRGREPVGTAAAESIPTSGVAASRPAGAALAPAKQRRIRSILIKTGALIGVGVAIGATMALSEGSPSKPPGSH